MSCYISSNNERIYCALESSYGLIPVIVGADRIPALKLKAKQVPEQTGRKDKTGTRTFVGMPNGIREFATFEVDTLLTEWSRRHGGAGVRTAVPMRDGRDAGDLGGRDGFVGGQRGHGDCIHVGTWIIAGAGGDVLRRDAIRDGDSEHGDAVYQRGFQHDAGERIGDGADDQLSACGKPSEREHFRLLGSITRRCSASSKARRWTSCRSK